MVKKFTFANIYDEACDHAICVTEHTRVNVYEIKRYLLNNDLHDY